MGRGFKPVMAILATGFLAACQLGSYGKSSPYAYDVADPIDVTIPANAPSVIQQFRPLTGELGPEAGGEHPGIDIYEARGFPVLAAADGVVEQSGFGTAYGNRIVIRHGAGPDGYPMLTVYKHLDSRAVQAGARVKRGQQIGGLGNTGVLAAGILHLHFEVHEAHGARSVPRDPHLYWAKGLGQITCFPARTRIKGFGLTYPVPCR